MSSSTSQLAQRHLAKIVETSDDAIVSKDLNGIIQSWNGAAERMFGYTAAEAIGRSIRMIIPADRQHEEDYVLGQIRSGQPVRHYETVRRRKDGTELMISLTVSPIVDDEGRVIGASKIARDITERARLEKELREQASINEQLSRVGVEIAATLDQGTIIEKVTELGTELTGARYGVFRDTFAGDRPLRLADATEESGAPASAVPRVPPGDPPARSVLAVPVKNADGAVVGGLLFGHPEPGRFTPHHEQLAVGMAAWASVALENARLYIEARDADRLKDEFLAVLSHELRTPLNAIVGYARLLRGGVLRGEKMIAGVEALERNATALTQIVEDVLDVSRIVSGKIRLDVQAVDLAKVVQDAIATVRPALDAKAIRLQTVVDPGIAPVSGDPERLQQVIWNLLSNAAKFTPKNGRVQVRVERVNSHVEIVVSDTGMGITRDFLPYVFDRFRQADSGTTRRMGGLGLGLSIVRHIVELHGGTVVAASEGEGKGATFRVRLPTMIVHAEPAREPRLHPRAAAEMPTLRLSGLSGVSILALDDDVDALGLLRVVLESAGAVVHTCKAAAEALARLAEMRPQALVVDLGMPEMDGFEFIREVRRLPDPEIARVPAAALTAFARSEDRVKALDAGFEMHLAKPVDPTELVAAVTSLVRRNASRA